jgi:hypothetical protein
MAEKKKATKGGALKTNPSNAAPSNDATKGLKRLSPGVYRNPQGQLTNSSGKRIDRRGRPVKTEEPNKAPKGPAAPAPTDAQRFANLTPEQQGNEMADISGQFGKTILGRAGQFDPNNPWANVQQQGFTDQMNAARQSVMGEFERTMAPEFQRQDAEFQQRMAEQGIDPNSGAYQAQFRAIKESQNNARNQAQAQAFQLGSQYQQQGYEQFMGGQKLPFEQYAATSDMWKIPYATQMDALQAEKNRQAQLAAARSGGGATVRAAQIQADAARDTAAMQNINQYNQPQRQNPLSTAAQSAGNAFAITAANQLYK